MSPMNLVAETGAWGIPEVSRMTVTESIRAERTDTESLTAEAMAGYDSLHDVDRLELVNDPARPGAAYPASRLYWPHRDDYRWWRRLLRLRVPFDWARER